MLVLESTKYVGGSGEKTSLAVSLYSTNFKADTIKTEAAHAKHSIDTASNVVFFTDVLSVLSAFQTAKDTEVNDLSSTLTSHLQISGRCLAVDTFHHVFLWASKRRRKQAMWGAVFILLELLCEPSS